MGEMSRKGDHLNRGIKLSVSLAIAENLIDIARDNIDAYSDSMELTVHIPDELAERLKAAGGDLSRRALEALALEEYKLGHLTTGELGRLLGFETRVALDGFLKGHGVMLDYTLDDLERERQDLKRLGF